MLNTLDVQGMLPASGGLHTINEESSCQERWGGEGVQGRGIEERGARGNICRVE